MRLRILAWMVLLLLFAAPVLAAPELKIAAIEARNAAGLPRNDLAIADFGSVWVQVQNQGDTECTLATVSLDITEAENEQSILESTPSQNIPGIASGESSELIFAKSETPDSTQFKLKNTAEGVYRITATVKCDEVIEHSRSVVFSLFNNPQLDIPEMPISLALLVGLVIAVVLVGTNRTSRLKIRIRERK